MQSRNSVVALLFVICAPFGLLFCAADPPCTVSTDCALPSSTPSSICFYGQKVSPPSSYNNLLETETFDDTIMYPDISSGQCVNHVCQYTWRSRIATSECSGTMMNLSLPIGGGPGYDRIIIPTNETIVVGDVTTLRSALSAAVAGDVIYLDDDSYFNLTTDIPVAVPAGITLASGRGHNGSPGALVFTESLLGNIFETDDTTNSLVTRFTGFRLRGPTFGTVSQGWIVMTGIFVEDSDVEVDNMELYEFTYAAVCAKYTQLSLSEYLPGHVYYHHNYVHHCNSGTGYGITLSRSTALIEENLFDHAVHFIATSGPRNTNYEARNNFVLSHSIGHSFDAHGERDYNRDWYSGLWRFDDMDLPSAEFGTMDFSLMTENHGIFPTDTSGKPQWIRDGRFNTALYFTGTSYITVLDNVDLHSPLATVEAWVKMDHLVDIQVILSNTRLSLHLVDDCLEFSYQVATGGSGIVTQPSSGAPPYVTPGDWYHVCATFFTSPSLPIETEITLFVNGDPVHAVTNGHVLNFSPGYALFMGKNSGGNLFHGVMDEVRLYKIPLLASDVKLHAEGFADIAGTYLNIHHNTFTRENGLHPAIHIRGKPENQSYTNANQFGFPSVLGPLLALAQTNCDENVLETRDAFGMHSISLNALLPRPVALAWPSVGRAPLTVSFEARMSVAADEQEILEYFWDPGDASIYTDELAAGQRGTPIKGEQLNHTYIFPGLYTVTLTARAKSGVLTTSRTIVEVAPAATEAPMAFSLAVKADVYNAVPGSTSVHVSLGTDSLWSEDVYFLSNWNMVSVLVQNCPWTNQDADIDGYNNLDLKIQLNIGTNLNQVFADNVALIGTQINNMDFELGGNGWTASSGALSFDDMTFAGDRSLRLELNSASITQSISIRQASVLGDWPLHPVLPSFSLCEEIPEYYGYDDVELCTSSMQIVRKPWVVRDTSAYSNHGFIINSASLDGLPFWIEGLGNLPLSLPSVQGKVGIQFNGINQYISVPNMHMSTSTSSEGSIEIWAAPYPCVLSEDCDIERGLFSLYDANNPTTSISLNINGSHATSTMTQNGAIISHASCILPSTHTSQHWYLFSVTSNPFRVYVDGTQGSEESSSSTWLSDLALSQPTLEIGRNTERAYFKGLATQATLFAVSFTIDQVQQRSELAQNPGMDWPSGSSLRIEFNTNNVDDIPSHFLTFPPWSNGTIYGIEAQYDWGVAGTGFKMNGQLSYASWDIPIHTFASQFQGSINFWMRLPFGSTHSGNCEIIRISDLTGNLLQVGLQNSNLIVTCTLVIAPEYPLSTWSVSHAILPPSDDDASGWHFININQDVRNIFPQIFINGKQMVQDSSFNSTYWPVPLWLSSFTGPDTLKVRVGGNEVGGQCEVVVDNLVIGPPLTFIQRRQAMYYDITTRFSFDECEGTMVRDVSGLLHADVNGANWTSGVFGCGIILEESNSLLFQPPNPNFLSSQGTITLWVSFSELPSSNTDISLIELSSEDDSVGDNLVSVGFSLSSSITLLRLTILQNGEVILDAFSSESIVTMLDDGQYHHILVSSGPTGVGMAIDGHKLGVTLTNPVSPSLSKWTSHFNGYPVATLFSLPTNVEAVVDEVTITPMVLPPDIALAFSDKGIHRLDTNDIIISSQDSTSTNGPSSAVIAIIVVVVILIVIAAIVGGLFAGYFIMKKRRARDEGVLYATELKEGKV